MNFLARLTTTPPKDDEDADKDMKDPGSPHTVAASEAPDTTISCPPASTSVTSSTRSVTRDPLLGSLTASDISRDLKYSQASAFETQTTATTDDNENSQEPTRINWQSYKHTPMYTTVEAPSLSGHSSVPLPTSSVSLESPAKTDMKTTSVCSWQDQISSLEQQSSRIKANSESLMQNQIAVMRRELCESQKRFSDFKDEMQRKFSNMKQQQGEVSCFNLSGSMDHQRLELTDGLGTKDIQTKQILEEMQQEVKLLKAKVEIRDAAVEATTKTIKETQAAIHEFNTKSDLKGASIEDRVALIERELSEKLESQSATALQGQLQRDALRNRVDARLAKLEACLSDITTQNTQELEKVMTRSRSTLDDRELKLESRFDEAVGRIQEVSNKVDSLKTTYENSKSEMQRRLSYLDEIVSDNVEKTAQAVASASVQNECTKDTEKRIQQMIATQRAARETQETTLLGFIQDSREARDALESSMHEQLRLERTARDVSLNQIKEQITREMQARQTYVEHYEEVLLKERAGRGALEEKVNERLKILENMINNGIKTRRDYDVTFEVPKDCSGAENKDIRGDSETDVIGKPSTMNRTSSPIRKSDLRSGSMSPRCQTPGPSMKRVEMNGQTLSESQSNIELGVHSRRSIDMVMSPRCRTPGVPPGAPFFPPNNLVNVTTPVPMPTTLSGPPSANSSHQPPLMPPCVGPPPVFQTGGSGTAPSSSILTPRVLAPGCKNTGSSPSLSGAMSPATNVQRMFSYGASVSVPQPTPRQSSAHHSPPAPPQRQRNPHSHSHSAAPRLKTM